MKNLIQDTLRKIEDRNITPGPRWKYLVKKYGLWMLFVIVLILAAVSFSAAYDNVNSLDWDLYRFMHQSMLVYFLSITPYFWVLIIIIFLIAAFFDIRRTETGYRYSWPKILAVTVGGIAIFGTLLSFLGFGGKFNSTLEKNFPYYGRHMLVTKESQWMQPEKGFLAGTIISVSENKLELDDLAGKDWNILIDEKTTIKPSVNIAKEETIKIIGKEQGADNFQADEIRPWVGRGMMKGVPGQGDRMMNGNGAGGKMR